jgi:phage terminase large subunit
MDMNINVKMPEPFEELFNPDWRNIVYHGGRGSGKSWSIASSLIIRSLKEDHKILCTRQFQNSIADSVKSLLDKRINDLKLQDDFKVTDKYIESKNGSQFIFKGLHNNITSIQSIEDISIVWIEEAQSINSRSLEVLTPTIRRPGSQLIYSFNPYLPEDIVYQMFIENKRPRSFVRKINYDENPWFKDTPLYEEMLYDKEHNYERYLHVWEGDCLTISDAAVFKGKIEVTEFDTPKDAVIYGGIDFGFSVDHFAIITCFIDHKKRRLYINQAARKVKLEIDDTPDFIMKSIPNWKEINFIADSARPELISYLKKRKFNIKGAKKGKDSVIDGIEYLQNFKIVINHTLKDVITEFQRYSYKVDPHTELILPKLQDGNDHFVDSLRYSVEPIRNPRNKSIVLPPRGT